MTGEELRSAIDTLGISQEGLGRVLGLTGRQIRRYIAGHASISTEVERRVNQMVKEKQA